jgi:hypothetical protein
MPPKVILTAALAESHSTGQLWKGGAHNPTLLFCLLLTVSSNSEECPSAQSCVSAG